MLIRLTPNATTCWHSSSLLPSIVCHAMASAIGVALTIKNGQ